VEVEVEKNLEEMRQALQRWRDDHHVEY